MRPSTGRVNEAAGRPLLWTLAVAAVMTLLSSCADVAGPGVDPGSASGEAERRRAGGATTVMDATSFAFSMPAPNLLGERLDLHLDGDLAFEQTFVTSPADVNPGLGPVFNQASCIRCHTRDGRDLAGLLIRVSRPGTGPHGGPVPVEGFGLQIQDKAVIGVDVEARVVMEERDTSLTLPGGTTVTLTRPTFTLAAPFTALPADLYLSPRMPRPVFGLGLLEAVWEGTLLDLADPDDRDGDGISGRVNRVWDEVGQRLAVGRFGWKANQPTLLQQTAAAYMGDMGVTTTVFASEASLGSLGDDGRADDPELDDEELEAATFYVQTLAVPAPRDLDSPEVLRGEELFVEAGCAGCHVPRLQTGSLEGVPEVSNQTIYPYTDLLLHDMGSALADGRSDFEANGQEWRTAPLWGLGLTRTVNGQFRLLHDGRARGILEAILWHGGEAEAAREAVRSMTTSEREALLSFLQSL